MGRGKVYLVGAGPGDPGLFTLRGRELLERAEVVIYDYLANEELLKFAPPEAEKIYVGKKGGDHTVPQKGINEILVEKGRDHVVVRLKGGDPFIFGRGGEEAQELVQAGVPFEVVPGITSASGASAYAGIPLTHRDHAQSCFFVTGHLKDDSWNLDWPTLARSGQTLVIYMGLTSLPEISRQLIAHGMAPDTPAACIRHATLADQTTLVGTIRNLPELVVEHAIKPPALLIIGHVVSLHGTLNWHHPPSP